MEGFSSTTKRFPLKNSGGAPSFPTLPRATIFFRASLFFDRTVEIGEAGADLVDGADGEVDFVFEGEVGSNREGGQGSEVGAGAVVGAAVAEAVAGETIGNWDVNPEAEVGIVDISCPILGKGAGFIGPAGDGSVKFVVGPGFGAIVEDEVFVLGFDEDGGDFLVVGRVGFSAGVGKFETDLGDLASEGDPLFHDGVGEVSASGPVFGEGFAVKAGLGGAEFEGLRAGAMPMATLNGIPPPGLFIPQRVVFVAVVGLLDEAAAVPMIDKVGVIC